MIRVGVVLSGCGFLDGSEIHEAVSLLIALDRRGAHILCMAPEISQATAINHLNRRPETTGRSVIVESARIARGNIRDIASVSADELDALVFPGGYGAAQNLSTFATDGVHCKVNEDVARLITSLHQQKKPIGLACIAPVLAAAVLGAAGVRPRLTIGTDRGTADAINQMGGINQDVAPADICVDEQNRLVTTPCYMNNVGPWTVYQGAEKLVEEVLRLAGDTASIIRGQMAGLPGRK